MEDKQIKLKKIKARQELVRMFKFVLCMISAGAIQMGLFSLLHYSFSIAEWLAHGMALVVSVIWSFTINRKFTFKSANNVPVAMVKVGIYNVVLLVTSMWWTAKLANTGMEGAWIEVINLLINFVTEMIYDRFVVFGKSINTNEAGKKEEEKIASTL